MKPTLLVLLLLTTGCVTLAPLSGQDGAPGLRAVSELRLSGLLPRGQGALRRGTFASVGLGVVHAR